jgi:hypothetical protein
MLRALKLANLRILVVAFTTFVLYMALANLLSFLNVITLPLEGFDLHSNSSLLLLGVLEVLVILQYNGRKRKEATMKT